MTNWIDNRQTFSHLALVKNNKSTKNQVNKSVFSLEREGDCGAVVVAGVLHCFSAWPAKILFNNNLRTTWYSCPWNVMFSFIRLFYFKYQNHANNIKTVPFPSHFFLFFFFMSVLLCALSFKRSVCSPIKVSLAWGGWNLGKRSRLGECACWSLWSRCVTLKWLHRLQRYWLESKDRWLTVWANCLQSLRSCED